MKLNPTPIHTEKAFEEAIESSLLQKGGYLKGNPDDFNRELALDTIDFGVRYKMAYFKPASGLNPEAERLYKLNRLSVTR